MWKETPLQQSWLEGHKSTFGPVVDTIVD
jgi:hypothetical protein